MPKTIDLAGKTFGRLTVIALAPGKRQFWRCRCSCDGKETFVYGSYLRGGQTTSCGCRKHVRKGSAFRAVLQQYQEDCRKKKREWGLSDREAYILLTRWCAYCLAPPARVFRSATEVFVAGGIDRVDSSRAYTLSNVVSCCTRCNYMKRTLSSTEFLDHCRRVAAANQTPTPSPATETSTNQLSFKWVDDA